MRVMSYRLMRSKREGNPWRLKPLGQGMETEFKGRYKHEHDFLFNCWADRKIRSMYRWVFGSEVEI